MAIHQWSKNANVRNWCFDQIARNCATKFLERRMIFNLKGGFVPAWGDIRPAPVWK